MTAASGPGIVWVTGAGSGMGRAAAVAAAARGWRVALTGRRAAGIDQTARLVEEVGGQCLALPLDLLDPAAVTAGHENIVATWGAVTDLVLGGRAQHTRALLE